MRLREIQKIIDKNIENIEQTESTYDGSSQYFIPEYNSKFKSISEIYSTGIIQKEFDDLIQNSLLVNGSHGEKILFSEKQSKLFIYILSKIVLKCTAVSDLITQNLHAENEDINSLVISLPNRELAFNEFNDIVKTLNDTLKLLNFLPEFQNDIKLSNFDVGSEWFVISFVTNQAIKMFGRISTLVQRTQVGIKQNKALDLQLEALDLDSETLAKFKQATAEVNTKIYQDLANDFLDAENISDKEECLNNMTKVIENTDKLMNIGVGFEAAITATNEVANTFPPLIEQKKLDKIKSIESIKQIEEQSNTDSSDEKED